MSTTIMLALGIVTVALFGFINTVFMSRRISELEHIVDTHNCNYHE